MELIRTTNIKGKYTIENFWNKLLNLDVSDCTYDYKVFFNEIRELSIILNHILPKFVYRYQAINCYTIENLLNDSIYGSKTSVMNDNLEATGFYSIDDLRRMADDMIPSMREIVQTHNIPNEFKGAVTKFGLIMNYATTKNVELSIPYIEKAINECHILLNYLQSSNELHNTLKEINNNCHIACFTECFESDYMASIYGDRSRGIILQYKVSDLAITCTNYGTCPLNYQCNNLHFKNMLIPINYSNEKYNISNYIFSTLFQYCFKKANSPNDSKLQFHTDMLWNIKLLATKGPAWKQEREWRLINCQCNPYEKSSHALIHKAKPSAIYLLSKISETNKNTIINIARLKNIPIYQLKEDYSNSKYNSFRKEQLLL